MKKFIIYLIAYIIITTLAFLDNQINAGGNASIWECIGFAAVLWFIVQYITDGFLQKTKN